MDKERADMRVEARGEGAYEATYVTIYYIIMFLGD